MNSTAVISHPPQIVSERLLLKPISMEHCTETYVGWMNDPDVILYLESGGNYTIELLKEYIDTSMKKGVFFWGIHLKENEKHIGNIKIDPINYRHGFGEYGILMGDKEEWGKGYAKEASKLCIDFCFDVLKLRKVNLGVIAVNKGAVELYKKLGFVIEGLFKEHGFYDNKLEDLIRMTIFNNR